MNGFLKLDLRLLIGFSLVLIQTICGETCHSWQIYCSKTGKCESIYDSECRGTCIYGLAQCDSSKLCYSALDRCDGRKKCPDGVDEKNCESSCSFTETSCDNGRTCFSSYEKCDGYRKCLDGADEVGCNTGCMFNTCNDGGCYTYSETCDGGWDCNDGTDENSCSDSDDYADDDSAFPSTGTIIGIVCGSILFFVFILCCKKLAKSSQENGDNAPGSVAYHSAANYRQGGNFEASHTHRTNASTASNTNYYPVDATYTSQGSQQHAGTNAYIPSSSTQYVPNSTPISSSYVPPSNVTPTAPYLPQGGASNYPPYPYPPSPDAGDTALSSVAAPPPTYESLFPEGKSNTG